jgi:hypothetical protein
VHQNENAAVKLVKVHPMANKFARLVLFCLSSIIFPSDFNYQSMKNPSRLFSLLCLSLFIAMVLSSCNRSKDNELEFYVLTKAELRDKIKGAWAAQTIGVTYGGPTEFRYNKRTIPDSILIAWSDTMMSHWMTHIPALYDDVYMDLTFVEVMEKEGIDAPAIAHARAYAEAEFWLWHANQQGRFNILSGIPPPESGHWLNNPHADDIDFQIEADFAGIMTPGMPNSALQVCDRIGHIMNYGDGYYGGLFMATMYSYAFVKDDIEEIIQNSLRHIPKQSTFHQCISDVIEWHRQFPKDWRKNWQMIEDRWGEDIGCPDGVHRDFNIDAKLNAAYVVLGLLYGNGDIGKTMEISTRAGQDSDCNPASSGAIVGTIIGYDAIPKYWSSGLDAVEDMDFQFTSTSLNDVYEISYRHALEMIEKNGGIIEDERVKIAKETPKKAPLEQSFAGYKVQDRISINKKVVKSGESDLSFEFSGIGVVLTGRVRHMDFDHQYALLSAEETMDGYKLSVDFLLDGKLSKNMILPLSFIERSHELYFQYEIPEGTHTLTVHINNPHEKVYLMLEDMIVYSNQ